MRTIEIEKKLIAEEDLALANAETIQQRDGVEYEVTPLQLFKIVRNIEELREVLPSRFPQAVIFNGAEEVGGNTFYFWESESEELEDLPNIIESNTSTNGRWVAQPFGLRGNFVTTDTPQTILQGADKRWINNNTHEGLEVFSGINEVGQLTLALSQNAENLKMVFTSDEDGTEEIAFLGYKVYNTKEMSLHNKVGELVQQGNAVTQKLNEGESETKLSDSSFYAKINEEDYIFISNDRVKLAHQSQVEADSSMVILRGHRAVTAVGQDVNLSATSNVNITGKQLVDIQSLKSITIDSPAIQVKADNSAKIESALIELKGKTTLSQGPMTDNDAVWKKYVDDADSALTEKIKEVEQDVETNKQDIHSNATSIAANSSNISNINSELGQMSERLDHITEATIIVGQIQETKDQVETDRQTKLTAFVKQQKSRDPLSGDVVFTTDSYAYYYTTSWSEPYTVSIPLFSTVKSGRIKGVEDTEENDGKITPVGEQGEGRVVGFDRLKAKVESIGGGNYVTVDTEQNITGKKRFENGLFVGVGRSETALLSESLTVGGTSGGTIMLDTAGRDVAIKFQTRRMSSPASIVLEESLLAGTFNINLLSDESAIKFGYGHLKGNLLYLAQGAEKYIKLDITQSDIAVLNWNFTSVSESWKQQGTMTFSTLPKNDENDQLGLSGKPSVDFHQSLLVNPKTATKAVSDFDIPNLGQVKSLSSGSEYPYYEELPYRADGYLLLFGIDETVRMKLQVELNDGSAYIVKMNMSVVGVAIGEIEVLVDNTVCTPETVAKVWELAGINFRYETHFLSVVCYSNLKRIKVYSTAELVTDSETPLDGQQMAIVENTSNSQSCLIQHSSKFSVKGFLTKVLKGYIPVWEYRDYIPQCPYNKVYGFNELYNFIKARSDVTHLGFGVDGGFDTDQQYYFQESKLPNIRGEYWSQGNTNRLSTSTEYDWGAYSVPVLAQGAIVDFDGNHVNSGVEKGGVNFKFNASKANPIYSDDAQRVYTDTLVTNLVIRII